MLSWNNIAGSGVERMIIWHRPFQPVPLVYDVSTLGLDSIVPSVTDTAIAAGKLLEKARYYFGAQVYKNGLWSYITDSASATDSTPPACCALDSNTVKITSIFFDTTKNQIRVKWTINTAGVDTAEIGVSYSLMAFPALDSSISQVIVARSAFDSAVVLLKEPCAFDTKYYVALWERRRDGAWTAPTSNSKDSVRTPGFHWQDVVYFSKENDTVYAFNKKLRFANIPGDLSKTQNTVRIFIPAPASLKGFIPVSVGFDFGVKDAGLPFNIALKIDSVPAGQSLGDIRIYRWSTSGQWLLDILPWSIDYVHGYVSELTNRLDYPFIAMVDTIRPLVHVLNSTRDTVPPDVAIRDTICISDNIANLRWWFKSSKGGESYATGDTSQFGVLSAISDTILVIIPRTLVSQDNGVRAIFIVSDGTFTDTLDLSRTVGTSGIIRRAAPVAPFISLTKSDRGYIISFGGYNRGEVRAVIYSVKGQLIRQLKAQDYGKNMMFWDYKDSNGKHATNGLYLMEIKAGAKTIKQKVIVTR